MMKKVPLAVSLLAAASLVAGAAGVQPAPKAEAGGSGAPRPAGAAAPAPGDGGFEGRYRHGGELASVRIVVFTDYQCPDCDTLDQRLEPLIADRPEIAVSVKHFPFSTACNPNVPRDLHPNACWAARAAEAAGILRGADGFWAMHRWLFSRRGGFTDAELRDGLRQMGYDPATFERVMTSPQTLQGVQADIAEAMGLGLTGTPMIFINGKEVGAWRTAGVLERAIAEAAQSPPATSAADRPPTAIEKHIADWRARPRLAHVADASARWLSAGDEGAITVVIWGDMQEPNTAMADAEVRRLVAAGRPIRYAFRHFPVDQSCNAAAPRTLHPAACAAARVREAAFAMEGGGGGDDAGWRVHAWLMDNIAAVRAASAAGVGVGGGAEGVALAAARASEMDGAAMVDALRRAEIGERIGRDAAAAAGLGVTSIPLIYIDGRHAAKWTVGATPILGEIMAEAGAGR